MGVISAFLLSFALNANPATEAPLLHAPFVNVLDCQKQADAAMVANPKRVFFCVTVYYPV